MQIRWLDRAVADLDDAIEYLLQRGEDAAHRTYAAIRDHVALLAEQPALGRLGRVAGTRELVVPRTPYIVAYLIDHRLDAVVILRVLHGARRWPDEL